MIVHTDERRDFSIGDLFSGEYYSYGTIIHEISHALFGLTDEYCCDSSYWSGEPYPNVWPSNESCRTYAIDEGWDPDSCQNFCTKGSSNCGNGWWRSDPDPDVMKTSGGATIKPFQRADVKNVKWTFEQYIKTALESSLIGSQNKTKTAIVSMSLDNNVLNLTEFKIIYNSAPDYISENGELNFTTLTKNTIVRSFLVPDPRIILTKDAAAYKNQTDFTVSTPLTFNEDKISIYNSTNLLLSINVTPYIKDFCNNPDGFCDVDCGLKGDVDCEIFACYNNLDCGSNGWIGNLTCSNDDVYRNYRTYTCKNPGTSQANCTYVDTLTLKQDCENDTYSESYCYDDDVYKNFTDKGCSLGACFENMSKQKIEDCGKIGCEGQKCRSYIWIKGPENGKMYSTKKVFLNITLKDSVKDLSYRKSTGRWTRLCSNCNSFLGNKTFTNGMNSLTIRAVTYNNNIYYAPIMFNIDATKPRIISTSPSKQGNGNFGVKYTEPNLDKIILYYWPATNVSEINKKIFTNCMPGTNIWCYNYTNVSKYNGKYVYYKFLVQDKFRSTNSSTKKIKIVI